MVEGKATNKRTTHADREDSQDTLKYANTALRLLGRSGPQDTAARSVLQAYELLEQILLGLDFKDLFVVQRVSSTWKSIISRSEGLQKKMFLLADGPPLTPTGSYHRPLQPQYTGLIRFNPAITSRCDFFAHLTYDCESESCHHVINGCDLRDSHNECDNNFGCVHIKDVCAPENGAAIRIASCPDRNAESLAGTYLTQPPVTAMRTYDPSWWVPEHVRTVLRNGDGIKLHQLTEAIDGKKQDSHWRACKTLEPPNCVCADEIEHHDQLEWYFALEQPQQDSSDGKQCFGCKIVNA